MAEKPKVTLDLFQLMESFRLTRRSTTNMDHIYDMLGMMPSLPEDEEDLFWKDCVRHPGSNLTLLGAVRYKRIDQLLNLKEFDLTKRLKDTFFSNLLLYLVFQCRWPCLKMILEAYSSELLTDELLSRMSREKLDDAAGLGVFRMLLDRCSWSHGPVLREVVRNAMDLGYSHSFRILVYSCRKSVRQVVLDVCSNGYLMVLMSRYCDQRAGSFFCNEVADFKGCLSVACRSGLFSASVFHGPRSRHDRIDQSALAMAVRYRLPDVADFLYTAGVVTYPEVFKLNLQLPVSTPSVDGSTDTAMKMRDFMAERSSRPRSLRSLCVLLVSGRLGWGHAKEANLAQLDIAPKLKDGLNFKGIEGILM